MSRTPLRIVELARHEIGTDKDPSVEKANKDLARCAKSLFDWWALSDSNTRPTD